MIYYNDKKEIAHEMIWTRLRNEPLNRETESLLKAAQNNVRRTNHVKAKIDNISKNINCRLHDDRFGGFCFHINLCRLFNAKAILLEEQ